MAAQTPDVTVVGHFSADSIKLPGRSEPYRILGGAVAYVSLVARRLGALASVISRVGGAFPDAYLKRLSEEGINISNVIKNDAESSTSFELTYSADLSDRTLRLRQKGSPINLNDLPASWRSNVVHVAPIADEISYDVVKRLRDCCSFLSIDPQGMTRRFDKDGNVTCSAQMDKRILPLVDVYKSSLDEIKVLTGQSALNRALKEVHDFGPKVVIATAGAEGSVLSTQGVVYKVPACKSLRVVDPTGAGDVFVGGFLLSICVVKSLCGVLVWVRLRLRWW